MESILLDYGADLNVIDDLLQSSPLGWAVRWGKYDLARLYLERGADPTLAGADWATPLVWADRKRDTMTSPISSNGIFESPVVGNNEGSLSHSLFTRLIVIPYICVSPRREI